MASITYRYPDKADKTIEVPPGTSVMKGAIANDIDGIIGECGGQAMCATCHVYVVERDASRAPGGQAEWGEMAEMEEEMLDCVTAERRSTSRLGCQLKAGEHFEHIVVDIPDSQI